ncbi:MAG: protein kinase, partial [Chloroflexota bacterium]
PSGALLVMRWLSGGSLRQQLKKGRMTIPQIVQTFNQIVKALAFAHRHNVIHRDIKPENILLDEERNAFLTDFGIAVDMRNQDEQNIENISFGSPDYVAPEQLGKNKTLTHHSDIYSLGIMLYELLAHQRPFVSKDPKEIIRMQMYHPVPSLRLARPDLPAEIDTIIWSATAKNPSMRYDTVIKFAQAFQRIAQRIEYIRPDYLIPMPEDTIEPVSNQNNIYLDNPTDSKTEVFATGSLNTEQFDVMPVGISDSTDDLDDAGTPALGLDGTPSLFDSPDIDNTENLDTIVDMLVPDVEDAFDAEMTADLSGGFEAGDAGTINLNANGFRVANFYSAVPSNPYKGLRAFGEGDTDQFFGREALVKSILEELADDNRRFMALIGRSGSGKSSVVRAGVIPALKRDAVPLASKWFYSTMVPSDDPYREISDALLGVAIFAPDNWSTLLRSTPDGLHALIQQMLPDDGSEVFLFIDQFEELFTLTQDENIRNDFLTSLAYAVSQPDSRLRLMLTMRADFFGYPLEYEAFAGMFSKHNEAVPPLSREQLRSTIVEPARLAGIIIEDMLVNALLDAVEEQPGALPLLQYTLTEMVNELIAGADVTSGVSARRMTFSKYESMGGIAGALVQRANAIYDKLTPEAQDIARLLFLSIVTVAEGKPTSRTTIWTDLQVDDRDLLERIIEAFSKYRLLSTDQDPVTRAPTVEVAHEALIQEWGLFKDWIEANNESLRIRYELEVERSRWLSYDKDTSFLATGLQLAQFESLLTDDFVTLGKDEREYIIASRDEEDRELRDIRNRNQLLQIISTGFAIASIFAFGLVFLSINLRDDAISAQNRAENNLLIARSRGLASSAIANLDQNDLALLLSTEAYQLDNTYESINSLLLALQANPLLDTYLHGHVGGVRAVAFDNSGDYAVSVDTRRTILRWDLTTNTPIGDSLSGHGGEILDVAISSQNIIASASIDGTVRLWDFETGEELAVLEHPREVYSLAFSPDGAQLASSYGVTDASGTILVWDIETNEIIETIDNAHDDVIASLDYNNDGSQLASAGRDSMVKLWDTADYSLAYTLEGHGDGVNALDFDPLGNALASTGNDRAIIIWNPRTGRQIGVLPRSGHTGDVLDIAYDATGTLLATGSADSTIIIFDLLQDFAPISTINTHNRNVHSVAFSPIAEDTRLLSGSDDSTVVVSTVQSITRDRAGD